MVRIVGWFCVLVVAPVAQTQNSDKVDVKTFLENIKKMLQETVEKMRKQQENRMKRRKDKKNKIKTRKMLMNKLANPYIIFRRQHTVINVSPPSNRDNLQDNNNGIDVNTGGISNQTINNVLKSNPVFNPFRTDRLKDILSKIQRPQGNVQGNVQNSSTSSGGNTEPDPQTLRYERELYNWLDEVYSKIDWFWDKVYRLFILDEKRFKYLSKVLCKGEITTPASWGYYNSSVYQCNSDNLPKRFKVISLDSTTNMPCDSLEPNKLRVDTGWLGYVITCVEDKYISSSIYNRGQCTPSLYTKAKLIGKMKQQKILRAEGIRPPYTSGKSLCYNLAALNFFGYKNGLEKNYNSAYISSKISSFILYIQFMEKIFKGKIFPTMTEMCYERCLCNDMGIGCTTQQRELSQEEKIIIVLWNLQRGVFLYSIDSLSKLISFKEGLEQGKVAVCDKMQDDFKKIMGNIGKDIVEKKDKLIQMKKKIEDMEREGEVDISVYWETIKLVEEVRKELTSIREELIELWQKRLESVTSLDDLKCVLDSFRTLIESISVDKKNVLELSFNNLISLVKGKLGKTLRKLADQVETVDNVTEWLDVGMFLKNTSYELKDIVGSESSPKIKGLSEFIKMLSSVSSVDTLYVSFQRVLLDIEDLFTCISVFDYSIYALTAAFNALKCVIDSVSVEDFLEYLASQRNTGVRPEDATFLKCFMSGGKTIKQCAGEKYGVIETIIGDVTIDSLGDLKDRIEKLKGYMKWGYIPTIKDCCGDGCSNIHPNVNKWCEALTSPIFKECCKPPLGKCCDTTQQPGCNISEPFCLKNNPSEVNCNSGSTNISTPGSPCISLSSKLVSLFSISYNNNNRRIFCDVIDKYGDFCNDDKDPVTFINNIQDSNGKFVMENTRYGKLKCECVKCSKIPQDVCELPISINYEERNRMEKFLERVGLLEEAKKAIEGGLLKNLGICPYQ